METETSQKISAVMIVRNEIHNLKKTLPSLSFCDEIVIVDSGSNDGSSEFAESLGCKVMQRRFEGYGPQKAYAVTQAAYDWIFSVDADEVVTPELASEIRKWVSQAPVELSGVHVRRRLYFLGKVFCSGRESREKILRLFRKSRGNFNQALVHEQVKLEHGRIGLTEHALLHESYSSIYNYVEKMNRYTTFGAQEILRKIPRRSGVFWASLFPLKFFHFYLYQLNFLNGWPGLCWSVLSTHAYFVKYLKLAELKKERKSGHISK